MVPRPRAVPSHRGIAIKMDRKKLQELEGRCIQEEAPTCVAACPIHVDVKTFLARVAAGAWDEAVRVLAATMPLPGIVGRICDHPCQIRCRRIDAGGAIAIADLERAALRRGGAGKGQPPMPAKERRVAIVGGALSGLVAAWDLARKGYQVTILADGEKLGGVLRAFPEDVLPDHVIEEELRLLEQMGVKVIFAGRMDAAGWIEAVRGEFDAVYAGLDETTGADPPIAGLDRLTIDPFTLSTTVDGLFVGRKGADETGFSPIGAVAEGRKAATSIDRYLQKVSLTAGREREGPYETKLYTNLEGVTAQPTVPMEDRASGYGDADAMQEAGRCIGCECMECVKACLFLERFKWFPKRYVRQIGNDETMVMGSHGQTISLVNSCSLCGLCETVCPNGLSMARVCMDGRASLVARGKMAPSAHDSRPDRHAVE